MKMLIGGEQRDSQNGKTLKIYNTISEELLDIVPDATEKDILESIEKAQEGKKIWGDTPLYQRSKILLKYANIVEDHMEELAELLSKETGKLFRESLAEVDTLIKVFRGYVEKANHLYGLTVPNSQEGFEHDIIFTRTEPLGVIAMIVPFNYPIDLFSHKAAPALIAGNAIIVKPSSENPLSVMQLVQYLIDAGVPGEAAQVVTGSGSNIGKWLCLSPHIDAVSFTGSTKVGIEIAKLCAENLHRVFLELGGNDALIIFDDADLELAVEEAVSARTVNAGQTCCGAKRFIVQKTIAAEFTTKLVERLKKVKIGNPFDAEATMGSLINERAALGVEEQVNKTIEQGAKCIYGGKRFNKTFFEPTVLTNVTPDMDISKDMEVFGSVFPIIPFDTLEDAIEIANNSKYGLMGGVITSEMNKAMKVATRMLCGGVVANGAGTYRPLEIAFGGYKMSGIGREGISYTLDEMTQVKTIILKNVLI